jgi:2Fe-2S ferredoxin
MPSIKVTDPSGDIKDIEFEVGLSLMEVLRDEGYDEILAICGGSCSCATCHVHITKDPNHTLPEIEEDELILLELEDEYNPQQSRLSCQLEMTDECEGLTVTILDA